MRRPIALLIAALSIMTGSVRAEDLPRVLVYSRTAGFRHDSIPDGIAMLRRLGQRDGFEVDATEDPARFNDQELGACRAVVFLSTTGDVLDARGEEALARFIEGGGGWVGIHAAADTEYDWPWYAQLVCAHFKTHPAIQPAEIHVTDRSHPSTAHLPARWRRTDEWYDYKSSARGRAHVLMSMDEHSYRNATMGYDHPISWCRTIGLGRAWYTGLGHTRESFTEEAFVEHVAGGLAWALGRREGEAGGTREGFYEKVILDDHVMDPMELAVDASGRVYFVERGGAVKTWHPESSRTTTAGFVDVFTDLEDGLLGIALDPQFEATGWLYLYYAPRGEAPINRLSRFTLDRSLNELIGASESILLEIPTQREECCHSGGSLTFDRAGNLLLSTGDNTSPFASDGYAPIDEREGRMPFDAQKSSSSTMDLRGKILRITPLGTGGYTIPEGNLFPPGSDAGRAEIYAMGCRNPFRISVDPATGEVFWGEVGPDAGSAHSARGPAGHDEFNRAPRAGNFGWPYFIAENLPYFDHDFETGTSGAAFDPSRPLNRSPNRNGAELLPPAQEAWIAYPYAKSERWPMLGEGGRCAMAGPVIRRRTWSSPAHPDALPASIDDAVLLYEWTRNWIKVAYLDEKGDLLRMDPLAPEIPLNRPMDLELGPDGRLYGIDWGTGFGGGNADSTIFRIDHHRDGRRPPRARIEASPSSGALPLTVHVTAVADESGPKADFAWDLDGDGHIDARGGEAHHTFTRAGVHMITLFMTAADQSPGGPPTVTTRAITAGNTQPVVEFLWPPDGGVLGFGESCDYKLFIHDEEERAPGDGALEVRPLLGHDTHAHPLHALGGTAGRFSMERDAGHGAEADLFTVLQARWRDGGGDLSLTGRAEVVLQPRRKQAEHAVSVNNARVEKTDDRDGGGAHLIFEKSGAEARYGPIDLHGIDAIRLRVQGGVDPASLEMHLEIRDADRGVRQLVGRAQVGAGGRIPLERGKHAIRVEYFEAGGQAGLEVGIIGPPETRREGHANSARQVIPPGWLSHGGDVAAPSTERGGTAVRPAFIVDGAFPGLHASWFELDSPGKIPDFSKLSPAASSVLTHLSHPSRDGPLADSPRSDGFGVVVTGWLQIPTTGFYAFSLSSDDGARLFIDGELLVDNDGLHAMTERISHAPWETIEIPVESTEEGGTLVITCNGDGGTRLNWIEFLGIGVGTGLGAGHGHDRAR